MSKTLKGAALIHGRWIMFLVGSREAQERAERFLEKVVCSPGHTCLITKYEWDSYFSDGKATLAVRNLLEEQD